MPRDCAGLRAKWRPVGSLGPSTQVQVRTDLKRHLLPNSCREGDWRGLRARWPLTANQAKCLLIARLKPGTDQWQQRQIASESLAWESRAAERQKLRPYRLIPDSRIRTSLPDHVLTRAALPQPFPTKLTYAHHLCAGAAPYVLMILRTSPVWHGQQRLPAPGHTLNSEKAWRATVPMDERPELVTPQRK